MSLAVLLSVFIHLVFVTIACYSEQIKWWWCSTLIIVSVISHDYCSPLPIQVFRMNKLFDYSVTNVSRRLADWQSSRVLFYSSVAPANQWPPTSHRSCDLWVYGLNAQTDISEAATHWLPVESHTSIPVTHTRILYQSHAHAIHVYAWTVEF